MIPKKIHYCWFGKNPLNELAKKCIESWKKYCPDYEIFEWNEENFDLKNCPNYVQQAYEASKWAFVTDYVRLKVVHEYGGIYLDTDVEMKKNLDDFLGYEAFFGFEDEMYIATGLGFGAVKGKEILKKLMDDYETCQFYKNDGTYDLMACPVRNLHVFLDAGLKQNNRKQILDENILILPTEFLCPMDIKTGFLWVTENTHTVHHYSASWCDGETLEGRKIWQKKNRIQYYKRAPFRFLRNLLGEKKYEQIRMLLLRKGKE